MTWWQKLLCIPLLPIFMAVKMVEAVWFFTWLINLKDDEPLG